MRCARRRRARRQVTTFSLPPLLLAAATASLSLLALRQLLSRRFHIPRLRRLGRRLKHITAPSSRCESTILQRLDAVRDRAVAQLDNERIAANARGATVEFESLSGLQRRELLAGTIATVARMRREADDEMEGGNELGLNGHEGEVVEDEIVSEKRVDDEGVLKKRDGDFWRFVESVNGRAAALGFVVCLAREIVEPGHPSLVEQVSDVVIPIAQRTPPFLVAVVDRIMDLVT